MPSIDWVIERTQLLAFRARRQHLAPETRGRTAKDVLVILKALQPFQPVGMPGSPPHPHHRIEDYDVTWSQAWRQQGSLIKGRFNNGKVGYVVREDLALYAAAFRRPLRDPIPLPARSILGLLERHGAMPKSALRELTDLDRERFNRTLMALFRAFEVMELQRDVDWDSSWDLYQRAFQGIDWKAWEPAEAQAEVLRRFIKAFGPATIIEMGSWSGWRTRNIRKLVDALLQAEAIVTVKVKGQTELGYVATDDVAALEQVEPITPFLVVLPDNDPFVMPQASLLLKRFCSEKSPYCLGVFVQDGEIVGAAWGQYKRRYAHIEMLDLEPGIVDHPPLMDRALVALEAHVSGGSVPIWIHGINGPPDAPWVDDILTRNGYAWQDGYFVKEETDEA
jgi:hypothetical protein